MGLNVFTTPGGPSVPNPFFHRQKLMVLSNSLLKRRSRFRNARNNFMSYQRSIFEKIVTIRTPKNAAS